MPVISGRHFESNLQSLLMQTFNNRSYVLFSDGPGPGPAENPVPKPAPELPENLPPEAPPVETPEPIPPEPADPGTGPVRAISELELESLETDNLISKQLGY